jgi:hypothetical protein
MGFVSFEHLWYNPSLKYVNVRQHRVKNRFKTFTADCSLNIHNLSSVGCVIFLRNGTGNECSDTPNIHKKWATCRCTLPKFPHLVWVSWILCAGTRNNMICAEYRQNKKIQNSKSRNSSVGIALGYGLDDRGSTVQFPAGAGNFSLHHRVQNGSGAHPASYPMGTRGSFPGVKAAGEWSWPLTT